MKRNRMIFNVRWLINSVALTSVILVLGIAFGNCAKFEFKGTQNSASKSGGNGEGYGGKPIIDDIVGNPNGGAITVKGVNFGPGSASPVLWDDFEGGSDGNVLAATPKIGSWVPNSNAVPTYTNLTSHSGALALQANRTSTFTSSNFASALPDSPDFYVSFWFNYNYSASTTGHIELFHFFSDPVITSPEVLSGANVLGAGVEDWYSTFFLENTGRFQKTAYPANGPSQNVWHHFEALARQSAVGVSDGLVRFSIDGVNVYDQTSSITREKPGRWQWASFFEVMANFAGVSGSYIDDTFINTTWARVEIGDAPTYAASTHREIQVTSSWSNTNIAIPTVHWGSFAPGVTAYVYVINAGNVNSNGFPISRP